MQKMLRALAYIDLILGTIGSIVLAKDLGRTADIFLSSVYYERDWTLTICIFFAGLFGVLVLFAILFSVAEILDAQERLMARLMENKSSMQTPLEKAENFWVCPNCGIHNYNSVEICACGTRKP